MAKVSERIGFGVEVYGEVPDIGGDVPGENPEKHRIGPVLTLEFELGGRKGGLKDKDDASGGKAEHDDDDHEGPELHMAFGVLFGLNEFTSDVAVKWTAALEF